MDDFLAELQTKTFSAASTDKLMLDVGVSRSESAAKTDEMLVGEIMREFVTIWNITGT